MSYYSNLSITVRRKDKSPVTKEDLEKFEHFFFDEFETSEVHSNPHMCNDGKYIDACCQIYKDLEEEEILIFSRENPHLQIEVIEECEDYDIGNSRMLFEGEISEILGEVTYFEKPTLIEWEEGE